MPYQHVLFLCVANSARSQMAEGLARHRFGDRIRVSSAGSAPSRVNPHAIAVMHELGIDLTTHTAKSIEAIDPQSVDLVIALCAEASCPVFLGEADRWSWAMPDPDKKDPSLSRQTQLHHFRTARDAIAAHLDTLDDAIRD